MMVMSRDQNPLMDFAIFGAENSPFAEAKGA